jgi:hypothetical protein
VTKTKETLTLQSCLENALLHALELQPGVADPGGVSEELIKLVWDAQTPGAASVLKSLEADAGATPLERLNVAARERLDRLNHITAPTGQTHAEALGIDTDVLAYDFVAYFRLQLNDPGAPPEILALANMLGLSAVEQNTRQLLEMMSELRDQAPPPLKLRFDARTPLARDVAALVDANTTDPPDQLEVGWPPFTTALRALLELQEPDLRHQLLAVPEAVPRLADGTPDEIYLRKQVHEHARNVGHALELTMAVTRRLRDFPRRCLVADREQKQIAVRQFLTLANLKLVSLLAPYQLKPNAIKSAAFPMAWWPDILSLDEVKPVLGVIENSEYRHGSTLYEVQLDIVDRQEGTILRDLRIYAPRYVALTTSHGLYPGFVWEWAAPQVELHLATSLAWGRQQASHLGLSYDADTFDAVVTREPLVGDEEDQEEFDGTGFWRNPFSDPRLVAITEAPRVAGRSRP